MPGSEVSTRVRAFFENNVYLDEQYMYIKKEDSEILTA